MSTLKDEDIAKKVQQGEVDVFVFLVKRYEEKISRYCRRFIQSEEIDDIIQTVFIKAFININSFKVELKFSTWIYRICHNEIINFLKKKKTLPLFDFDIFLPYHPKHQTIREDLEDKVANQTLITQLDNHLSELPTKYKEALLLFYFEGLSYKEISQIVKAPVATIGARISRAKKILQKNYAQRNKK